LVSDLYRCCSFFFFDDPAPTEIYTLSLHDALPIWLPVPGRPQVLRELQVPGRPYALRRLQIRDKTHVLGRLQVPGAGRQPCGHRSEEHTSELQSRENLVCRLLLEKKKKRIKKETK